MKNNIVKVSTYIDINASAMTVFDKVTDWEQQEKWVYLTKVIGLGDNSHELGGKLEAFTRFGKIGFMDTMTITRWENNKLCEITHTGKIVKGKGVFEVSTQKSSTSFTWTEYVELPFGYIGRFGWIILRPVVKLGLWLSLRRLKNLIESTA